MNREQTKQLKARLTALNQRKLQVLWTDPPMPPKVAAAKRLLQRWKAKQNQAASRARDRINKAYSFALDSVLFDDDPKVVLRALATFERFKP